MRESSPTDVNSEINGLHSFHSVTDAASGFLKYVNLREHCKASRGGFFYVCLWELIFADGAILFKFLQANLNIFEIWNTINRKFFAEMAPTTCKII